MKFLLDFDFADWRFFEVCENKFFRREWTEISAGNKFLRFSFQAARLFSTSPLLYRLNYKVRREQAVGTEDLKVATMNMYE